MPIYICFSVYIVRTDDTTTGDDGNDAVINSGESTNNDDSTSSSLSSWQIVAIVIGAAVILLGGIYAAYICWPSKAGPEAESFLNEGGPIYNTMSVSRD